MPTNIKELPSKEYLNSFFYVKEGFVYWKERSMSRGRPLKKAHKRVNTYKDSLGYYRIEFHGGIWMLSRIIYQMTHGNLDTETEIDHIDRNRENNDPNNLRPVDQKVNKRNKSKQKNCNLTTGVNYNKKFHPGSTEKFSEYFVARWYDLDGNLKSKCFNIEKLGKEKAFEDAQNYRLLQISLLREQGAGYSESHGM